MKHGKSVYLTSAQWRALQEFFATSSLLLDLSLDDENKDVLSAMKKLDKIAQACEFEEE